MVVTEKMLSLYLDEGKLYMSEIVEGDYLIVEDFISSTHRLPIFNCLDKEITTFKDIEQSIEYKMIENSFRKNNYSPCKNCKHIRIMLNYLYLTTKITEKEIRESVSYSWCFCSPFSLYLQSLQDSKEIKKKYSIMKESE